MRKIKRKRKREGRGGRRNLKKVRNRNLNKGVERKERE